ncbi:MAG: 2Fe-2S iron-sulfur cluster binding domain-containing protein [Helicobacteraceae bacterium]|nr:2Fe-2S iron-sulfur cluster binding domain-containing protein [Helicobacteraceae bacterium]
MSLVTVNIDDKSYEAKENSLLIDLLILHDIKVPYFCYHESLGADGNCRMCMVEIEGKKRPQIACDTFVSDGMSIQTASEKISSVRKRILELELINHPVDCPICDQAGECKLQDYYMDFGLYDSNIDMKEKVHNKKHIALGSSVILDRERCVLCTRCVRFTSNITKSGELGVINRGDKACISTVPGMKLDNPYAMNVVDLCPVGALTSKEFRFAQRVWFLKSTPSICHGCSTGCNIFIDHNQEKYKEDKIYRIRPRKNREVNGDFICDYGRLSYKNLQENRQQELLNKSNVISYEDALLELNSKISGSKNIVILVDANLYNEDIAAISNFSQKIGAKLVCPTECYFDDSFGDDWLKSDYKCANLQAIKNYKIDSLFSSDQQIDLLINFNHPSFSKFSSKQSVEFSTHKGSSAELVLAIPAYSEYSGTTINDANIEQYSQKAITTDVATISEYLSDLSKVAL